MDTPTMKRYALYAGLSGVVATHVWLINASLPDSIKNSHAYLNLVSAGLIVYATMY